MDFVWFSHFFPKFTLVIVIILTENDKLSNMSLWRTLTSGGGNTQLEMSKYQFDIGQYHLAFGSRQTHITDFKLHIYMHVFGSRAPKYINFTILL